LWLEKYKDKDWLMNERFHQRRTTEDIARECGVSRKTIEHFIRKFGIPQPGPESEIRVDILCNRCKTTMNKRLRYLKQRIRKGIFKFYCDECLREIKREEMSGEGNPNFGGIFHGESPSTWSPEKRKAATIKMLLTRKQNGSLLGSKNGRWAGGQREVSCIICGNVYRVKPYVYRAIERGERAACCSKDCGRMYALTHVRSSRTSIEIKMAEELSRRGIEYIEQYNLGNKFALDFFLPEYGIVIECDGDYWHRLPSTVKRDRAKNAYIRACGYSLYRFWESEINTDVEACVDIVMAEINSREEVS